MAEDLNIMKRQLNLQYRLFKLSCHSNYSAIAGEGEDTAESWVTAGKGFRDFKQRVDMIKPILQKH